MFDSMCEEDNASPAKQSNAMPNSLSPKDPRSMNGSSRGKTSVTSFFGVSSAHCV